ncbi:uncharacterized protein LOC111264571 isoform X1 [Varroa jacobsoni]|uniref:WH1 domain-containing protein n=2 Tax=Varroa destructor TaxID=109461 RepID=A0A7M7M527_VARDE|nr:uncharacterized protein LOC111245512 isoform X1 [Varroa destructor]XP_022649702.1 uncharacterized protein LOC111245512 isoform X1 [Varroa destructor]XP_022649704.1 uncharacterized protein LOC111245512 isoform X1 [Varroa destructor]XP_022649705.1 uncharacterized protein LOC111245512 isoform X1 [Varroa destructor]XP_022649706.1 uncharacterized protein LOC111245512 isoform X1 [Varroa destructor]XP_022696345.1 uncharacterized protein LOC111264571 isoform X1 [Varroa jacobsoni]
MSTNKQINIGSSSLITIITECTMYHRAVAYEQRLPVETLYCTSDIVRGSMAYNDNTHEHSHAASPDTDVAEGRLSDFELEQIEHCYRSQKTSVYVASCLANLYFTRTDQQGNPVTWELSSCGVPVLILDKGESRARTIRQLQIVLAEKGTGFALWRDKIDNLSLYKCPGEEASFQTMYLSYDHREMIGLSFDLEEAAQEFYETVSDLCADPKNISLSMPKLSKKKSKSKGKKATKASIKRRVTKSEISSPICFQHVTSVDVMDREKLNSLCSLVHTLSLDVSSVESASTSGTSSSNSITSSHL